MKTLAKLSIAAVISIGVALAGNAQNIVDDYYSESEQTYQVGVALAELGIRVLDLSEVEKVHFLDGIQHGVFAEKKLFNPDVTDDIVDRFLSERENVFAITRRSELMQSIVTHSAVTENLKTQLSGHIIGYTLKDELSMSEEEAMNFTIGIGDGFYDVKTRQNILDHIDKAEQYTAVNSYRNEFLLRLNTRLQRLIEELNNEL